MRGKNYVSGETGSPIDYIGFHAKGRPRVVDGHVRMGSESQLADIDRGFEIVASFPELKDLPVIIGESDPEGCAACSARFHPQNAYRNGTMYSSYTAAVFARKYDLAARHGVNLRGAVTWAFEFEDQPYFDGFRDLATNGIDKPVLNVFRMFGLLGPERVQASSTGAASLDQMLEAGVKGAPDINVLAGRGARLVAVMVWNYHDDDLPAPAAEVEVRVDGLGAERVLFHHYRVDERHGNAYAAWKRMGSPQSLDEGALPRARARGQTRVDGGARVARRGRRRCDAAIRAAAPGRLAAEAELVKGRAASWSERLGQDKDEATPMRQAATITTILTLGTVAVAALSAQRVQPAPLNDADKAAYIKAALPLDEPRHLCIDVPGHGAAANPERPLGVHTCKDGMWNLDQRFRWHGDGGSLLLMPHYDLCLAARAGSAGERRLSWRNVQRPRSPSGNTKTPS